MIRALAALLYDFHIISTGIGVFGGLFALFFEKLQLPSTMGSWSAVLMLSIVCSVFGYVVQSIAQKYTTPTHTGLIFSLEPVFTTLFAYLFMNELMPLKGYVGIAHSIRCYTGRDKSETYTSNDKKESHERHRVVPLTYRNKTRKLLLGTSLIRRERVPVYSKLF
ncbi:DMT family transporter [Sporolactobacillus pectinivorans]|uniref:DMT family transporter n=1 Tax=Sporolactobacillus pectinivorans TaxID=1591408 RepID=UPI001EFC4B44|nr:DMT family transporter [Sporolactobacillus pectinivorans]